MAAALVRHDELVAGAVESHGGRFLKSKGEGDATFSVFESASDAVQAAIAATRALGAERWPNDWSITARFGIHTGEAERRDDDYFGPAVNLAARVRGEGGGGEILLSQLTADLTAKHLPAGYSLVDLGPHRLAASRGPQTLHAVAGPGVTAPRRRPSAPTAGCWRSTRTTAPSSSGARPCSARSSSGSRRGACSRSWERRAAGSPRCCAPA